MAEKGDPGEGEVTEAKEGRVSRRKKMQTVCTISERSSKVRIGKWPLDLKPWRSLVTFVRIIFCIEVRRNQVLNPSG